MSLPVYLLPKELRFDFARSRGIVVSGDFTPLIDPNAPSLSCIGDVVSSYCSRIERFEGVIVMVVDGKTRRTERIEGRIHSDIELKVKNPAGTVSWQAARLLCSLQQRGSGRVLVVVDGEEDMLALPSIACSPLGGYVVYGVPGRGAAVIRVMRWNSWDAQTRILSLKPSLITG